MRGGDGASTDVPIPPWDASDGRVSGLVYPVPFHAFLFSFSHCHDEKYYQMGVTICKWTVRMSALIDAVAKKREFYSERSDNPHAGKEIKSM